MVRVVVEEDAILRTVPVILDPSIAPEHEAAVAEFYRHDEPNFLAWRDRLRGRIPGLFPAEVVFADDGDFLDKIEDADAVIVETLQVGENELARARSLRSVLKFGSLPVNIDTVACARAGVRVDVQPRRVNVAVAEHAFAMLLSLSKRLPELTGLVTEDQLVAAGFDTTPYDRRFTGNSNFARITGIRTLVGATLGIVGLGEIGRELALRAAAFGMEILYFQRHRLTASEEWMLHARFLPLEELLGRCDYLSVNLPLNASTRGLIDGSAIAALKPGAIIVNVARAELIERGPLVEALASGQVGGLGLDVGYEEPVVADDPLLGHPNVLLTPHTAVANRWNALWDMEEMYLKIWRALVEPRR